MSNDLSVELSDRLESAQKETMMNSTGALPALITADEFLAKHGDESGIELVHGQIESVQMPSLLHGEVCVNVSGILRDFIRPRKLGRLFSNDSFIRTVAGIRGPDVMYISYETLSESVPTPDREFTPPVELVVEVRSRSQSFADLAVKAEDYLDSGVKVVLVLDPDTESAGLYRPREFPQRFHNGDILTIPDILPGFATPVKAFFER